MTIAYLIMLLTREGISCAMDGFLFFSFFSYKCRIEIQISNSVSYRGIVIGDPKHTFWQTAWFNCLKFLYHALSFV